MTRLSEIVNDLGGITTKRALVRRGANDRHLTEAVKSQDVVRVRNGWYSTFPESDPRLRAVRVGGRLTGISAIEQLGGWVHGAHPLHVSVPLNAARLRTPNNRRRRLDVNSPGDVALHWEARYLGERGSATVVALDDALVRVALDEEWDTTVAAFDWALHERRIDTLDFEAIILRLPAELHRLRHWVDPDCESLPESLARTRLRMTGHSVRSQHELSTGERVDLVVDDTVGLEIDGEKYHVGRFFADRDKDLTMTIEGFHPMRPSARHVFDDWPRVEVAIGHALRARGVGNSGLAARRSLKFRERPRRVSRRRRPTPEFPTKRGGSAGMRRPRGALLQG